MFRNVVAECETAYGGGMSTSSPGRTAPAAGDRATRPSGRLTPATHFVRAATCFAVAKAVQTSQGPTSAEVVARSWYPTDPVTAKVLRVTPGDTQTVVDVIVGADKAVQLAEWTGSGKIALVLDSRAR